MSAPQKFDEGRLAQVLVAPIISEKATRIGEKQNQVLFKVLRSAGSANALSPCASFSTERCNCESLKLKESVLRSSASKRARPSASVIPLDQ